MRQLAFRLWHLLRRRRFERELAEEMEFHRAMTSAREFGSLALAQDNARDVWMWPRLQSAAQDLRFAVRLLIRNPTFTIVAVLTLAVGIGANTAVFSVVNSVLLEPLSYPRAQELVSLRQAAPGAAGLASSSDGLSLSPSMYFTYAEQNRTFESLGVWVVTSGTVTGVGEPEQVRATGISDGLLQASVSRRQPAAGSSPAIRPEPRGLCQACTRRTPR